MMYSIPTHPIKATRDGKKECSLGWKCKLIEVTSKVDLACYKATVVSLNMNIKLFV